MNPYNPFEILQNYLNKANEMTETSKKIYGNNVKYQNAFIAYVKAIQDMKEAIEDNIKLMKNN